MKCRNCGLPIKKTDKYCTACGEKNIFCTKSEYFLDEDMKELTKLDDEFKEAMDDLSGKTGFAKTMNCLIAAVVFMVMVLYILFA